MPAKTIPIPVGSVFGRWVTIGESYRERARPRYVLCQCACGTEKPVRTVYILNGTSKSCGCHRAEISSARNTTHGHSVRRTPEYRTWSNVKTRCTNPNHIGYHHYGGRGISVCPRWMASFADFLADMGKRPGPKYQIDRVDVNGDYSPENCRWVTARENANNRRSNVRYAFNGESLTALEWWARQTGVSQKAVRARLTAGWEVSRALSQPLRFYKCAKAREPQTKA